MNRRSDITVADMENMTTLDLNGTQITDAGLVNLKVLPNLTDLILTDTQVTD